MSFLEINKNILLEKYPGLYEELTANDDDLSPDDIKTETTPAGEPTLSINGIYIHSPRDPAREAGRLVKTICGDTLNTANNPGAPVIILGFGLGYTAEAAAAFGMPVIIAEKHKNLFLKALELRDFSAFFSGSRLIFIIGKSGEAIINTLFAAYALIRNDDYEKKPPLVVCNKALASLDQMWYKQAEDRIRAWSMKDDVNIATHKRFGKRWVRNLSRNISVIRDLPGVSHLARLAVVDENFPQEASTKIPRTVSAVRNSRNSLPVFLAAAGPSLDRIKPLLCDIHERSIIVAVDTSFRFFIKNGITPDFVIVVDPQFWNSCHLDRCLNEERIRTKTALVAESAVYPPVLNLPFKNKFLCGSLFPFGTFIEKQVDPKGRLAAGGSVATTAWDFARILGGQEIWIAGLDLAFPQSKTHFRGARFEETAASQSNRFNPAEKWIVRALRDGKPFMALSANNNQVLTDQRLSLYKSWFESQFRQNPHVINRSFFQDGLAITGLNSADDNIEKFLLLPKRREEINNRIEKLFLKIEKDFNDPAEKQSRAQKFDSAVFSFYRGLSDIKAASEEGIEIIRRALRYPLEAPRRSHVIKELDEVTRKVTESEVKEIAGFLFPPVSVNEKNDMPDQKNENDKFLLYLNSSQELFSGIRNAAAQFMEYNTNYRKLI